MPVAASPVASTSSPGSPQPTELTSLPVARGQGEIASTVSRLPASLPVEAFELANGMRFLLVRRPEMATVAAGWAVRSGSADDPPGKSGVAHMLEHMLFKGSRTVGARDPEAERTAMAEEDRLRRRLDELGGGGGAAERRRLEHRLSGLQDRLRRLGDAGQLGVLYAEAGGRGLNAFTFDDLTLYLVTLPEEALELWFWLESDRLLRPVFRDFYTEHAVVEEERRRRMATPTGRLEEQLAATFWGQHPYGRPTLGRPEELAALSRDDARRHFARHYAPDQLTAALVGDFEPTAVRRLAERYFGRLEPLPAADASEEPLPLPPPASATWHPAVSAAGSAFQPASPPAGSVPSASAHGVGHSDEQSAAVGARLPTAAAGPSENSLAAQDSAPGTPTQRRFEGECDCRRQVHLLYRTVPFGHPDGAALEVLAGLLNGRTGRLHRALVLERGIAFSAFAVSNPLRRAGQLSLTAEARGESSHGELVAALEEELRRLAEEPIPADELTKVKNQITADAFRRLRQPAALMLQLLVYDALGDWRQIESGPARALAVTAADVQRVTRRYLLDGERTVGLFSPRGEETAAAPGAVTGRQEDRPGESR